MARQPRPIWVIAISLSLFALSSAAPYLKEAAVVNEPPSIMQTLLSPITGLIGPLLGHGNHTEAVAGPVCYHMMQAYQEGERIMSSEPCLNCTCNNGMLMCYLKVCPFSKPIGKGCKIEKMPGDCCPTVTCPLIPVNLQLMQMMGPPPIYRQPENETTAIEPVTFDKGCSIDGKYYMDGGMIDSDPEDPCSVCYCIRNEQMCTKQECTLYVNECQPVYAYGVCCPVKYECEMEMTTPSITTTIMSLITDAPSTQYNCVHGTLIIEDGKEILGDNPCQHCYCMKGEIACVIINCTRPDVAHSECTPKLSAPNTCCPVSYDCGDIATPLENVTVIEALDASTITPRDAGEQEDITTTIIAETDATTKDTLIQITEETDISLKAGETSVSDESITITETMPTKKETTTSSQITTIHPITDEEIPVTTEKLMIEIVPSTADDQEKLSETTIKDAKSTVSAFESTTSKIEETTSVEEGVQTETPAIIQTFTHEVGEQTTAKQVLTTTSKFAIIDSTLFTESLKLTTEKISLLDETTKMEIIDVFQPEARTEPPAIERLPTTESAITIDIDVSTVSDDMAHTELTETSKEPPKPTETVTTIDSRTEIISTTGKTDITEKIDVQSESPRESSTPIIGEEISPTTEDLLKDITSTPIQLRELVDTDEPITDIEFSGKSTSIREVTEPFSTIMHSTTKIETVSETTMSAIKDIDEKLETTIAVQEVVSTTPTDINTTISETSKRPDIIVAIDETTQSVSLSTIAEPSTEFRTESPDVTLISVTDGSISTTEKTDPITTTDLSLTSIKIIDDSTSAPKMPEVQPTTDAVTDSVPLHLRTDSPKPAIPVIDFTFGIPTAPGILPEDDSSTSDRVTLFVTREISETTPKSTEDAHDVDMTTSDIKTTTQTIDFRTEIPVDISTVFVPILSSEKPITPVDKVDVSKTATDTTIGSDVISEESDTFSTEPSTSPTTHIIVKSTLSDEDSTTHVPELTTLGLRTDIVSNISEIVTESVTIDDSEISEKSTVEVPTFEETTANETVIITTSASPIAHRTESPEEATTKFSEKDDLTSIKVTEDFPSTTEKTVTIIDTGEHIPEVTIIPFDSLATVESETSTVPVRPTDVKAEIPETTELSIKEENGTTTEFELTTKSALSIDDSTISVKVTEKIDTVDKTTETIISTTSTDAQTSVHLRTEIPFDSKASTTEAEGVPTVEQTTFDGVVTFEEVVTTSPKPIARTLGPKISTEIDISTVAAIDTSSITIHEQTRSNISMETTIPSIVEIDTIFTTEEGITKDIPTEIVENITSTTSGVPEMTEKTIDVSQTVDISIGTGLPHRLDTTTKTSESSSDTTTGKDQIIFTTESLLPDKISTKPELISTDSTPISQTLNETTEESPSQKTPTAFTATLVPHTDVTTDPIEITTSSIPDDRQLSTKIDTTNDTEQVTEVLTKIIVTEQPEELSSTTAESVITDETTKIPSDKILTESPTSMDISTDAHVLATISSSDKPTEAPLDISTKAEEPKEFSTTHSVFTDDLITTTMEDLITKKETTIKSFENDTISGETTELLVSTVVTDDPSLTDIRQEQTDLPVVGVPEVDETSSTTVKSGTDVEISTIIDDIETLDKTTESPEITTDLLSTPIFKEITKIEGTTEVRDIGVVEGVSPDDFSSTTQKFTATVSLDILQTTESTPDITIITDEPIEVVTDMQNITESPESGRIPITRIGEQITSTEKAQDDVSFIPEIITSIPIGTTKAEPDIVSVDNITTTVSEIDVRTEAPGVTISDLITGQFISTTKSLQVDNITFTPEIVHIDGTSSTPEDIELTTEKIISTDKTITGITATEATDISSVTFKNDTISGETTEFLSSTVVTDDPSLIDIRREHTDVPLIVVAEVDETSSTTVKADTDISKTESPALHTISALEDIDKISTTESSLRFDASTVIDVIEKISTVIETSTKGAEFTTKLEEKTEIPTTGSFNDSFTDGQEFIPTTEGQPIGDNKTASTVATTVSDTTKQPVDILTTIYETTDLLTSIATGTPPQIHIRTAPPKVTTVSIADSEQTTDTAIGTFAASDVSTTPKDILTGSTDRVDTTEESIDFIDTTESAPPQIHVRTEMPDTLNASTIDILETDDSVTTIETPTNETKSVIFTIGVDIITQKTTVDDTIDMDKTTEMAPAAVTTEDTHGIEIISPETSDTPTEGIITTIPTDIISPVTVTEAPEIITSRATGDMVKAVTTELTPDGDISSTTDLIKINLTRFVDTTERPEQTTEFDVIEETTIMSQTTKRISLPEVPSQKMESTTEQISDVTQEIRRDDQTVTSSITTIVPELLEDTTLELHIGDLTTLEMEDKITTQSQLILSTTMSPSIEKVDRLDTTPAHIEGEETTKASSTVLPIISTHEVVISLNETTRSIEDFMIDTTTQTHEVTIRLDDTTTDEDIDILNATIPSAIETSTIDITTLPEETKAEIDITTIPQEIDIMLDTTTKEKVIRVDTTTESLSDIDILHTTTELQDVRLETTADPHQQQIMTDNITEIQDGEDITTHPEIKIFEFDTTTQAQVKEIVTLATITEKVDLLLETTTEIQDVVAKLGTTVVSEEEVVRSDNTTEPTTVSILSSTTKPEDVIILETTTTPHQLEIMLDNVTQLPDDGDDLHSTTYPAIDVLEFDTTTQTHEDENITIDTIIQEEVEIRLDSTTPAQEEFIKLDTTMKSQEEVIKIDTTTQPAKVEILEITTIPQELPILLETTTGSQDIGDKNLTIEVDVTVDSTTQSQEELVRLDSTTQSHELESELDESTVQPKLQAKLDTTIHPEKVMFDSTTHAPELEFMLDTTSQPQDDQRDTTTIPSEQDAIKPDTTTSLEEAVRMDTSTQSEGEIGLDSTTTSRPHEDVSTTKIQQEITTVKQLIEVDILHTTTSSEKVAVMLDTTTDLQEVATLQITTPGKESISDSTAEPHEVEIMLDTTTHPKDVSIVDTTTEREEVVDILDTTSEAEELTVMDSTTIPIKEVDIIHTTTPSAEVAIQMITTTESSEEVVSLDTTIQPQEVGVRLDSTTQSSDQDIELDGTTPLQTVESKLEATTSPQEKEDIDTTTEQEDIKSSFDTTTQQQIIEIMIDTTIEPKIEVIRLDSTTQTQEMEHEADTTTQMQELAVRLDTTTEKQEFVKVDTTSHAIEEVDILSSTLQPDAVGIIVDTTTELQDEVILSTSSQSPKDITGDDITTEAEDIIIKIDSTTQSKETELIIDTTTQPQQDIFKFNATTHPPEVEIIRLETTTQPDEEFEILQTTQPTTEVDVTLHTTIKPKEVDELDTTGEPQKVEIRFDTTTQTQEFIDQFNTTTHHPEVVVALDNTTEPEEKEVVVPTTQSQEIDSMDITTESQEVEVKLDTTTQLQEIEIQLDTTIPPLETTVVELDNATRSPEKEFTLHTTQQSETDDRLDSTIQPQEIVTSHTTTEPAEVEIRFDVTTQSQEHLDQSTTYSPEEIVGLGTTIQPRDKVDKLPTTQEIDSFDTTTSAQEIEVRFDTTPKPLDVGSQVKLTTSSEQDVEFDTTTQSPREVVLLQTTQPHEVVVRLDTTTQPQEVISFETTTKPEEFEIRFDTTTQRQEDVAQENATTSSQDVLDVTTPSSEEDAVIIHSTEPQKVDITVQPEEAVMLDTTTKPQESEIMLDTTTQSQEFEVQFNVTTDSERQFVELDTTTQQPDKEVVMLHTTQPQMVDVRLGTTVQPEEVVDLDSTTELQEVEIMFDTTTQSQEFEVQLNDTIDPKEGQVDELDTTTEKPEKEVVIIQTTLPQIVDVILDTTVQPEDVVRLDTTTETQEVEIMLDTTTQSQEIKVPFNATIDPIDGQVIELDTTTQQSGEEIVTLHSTQPQEVDIELGTTDQPEEVFRVDTTAEPEKVEIKFDTTTQSHEVEVQFNATTDLEVGHVDILDTTTQQPEDDVIILHTTQPQTIDVRLDTTVQPEDVVRFDTTTDPQEVEIMLHTTPPSEEVKIMVDTTTHSQEFEVQLNATIDPIEGQVDELDTTTQQPEKEMVILHTTQPPKVFVRLDTTVQPEEVVDLDTTTELEEEEIVFDTTTKSQEFEVPFNDTIDPKEGQVDELDTTTEQPEKEVVILQTTLPQKVDVILDTTVQPEDVIRLDTTTETQEVEIMLDSTTQSQLFEVPINVTIDPKEGQVVELDTTTQQLEKEAVIIHTTQPQEVDFALGTTVHSEEFLEINTTTQPGEVEIKFDTTTQSQELEVNTTYAQEVIGFDTTTQQPERDVLIIHTTQPQGIDIRLDTTSQAQEVFSQETTTAPKEVEIAIDSTTLSEESLDTLSSPATIEPHIDVTFDTTTELPELEIKLENITVVEDETTVSSLQEVANKTTVHEMMQDSTTISPAIDTVIRLDTTTLPEAVEIDETTTHVEPPLTDPSKTIETETADGISETTMSVFSIFSTPEVLVKLEVTTLIPEIISEEATTFVQLPTLSVLNQTIESAVSDATTIIHPQPEVDSTTVRFVDHSLPEMPTTESLIGFEFTTADEEDIMNITKHIPSTTFIPISEVMTKDNTTTEIQTEASTTPVPEQTTFSDVFKQPTPISSHRPIVFPTADAHSIETTTQQPIPTTEGIIEQDTTTVVQEDISSTTPEQIETTKYPYIPPQSTHRPLVFPTEVSPFREDTTSSPIAISTIGPGACLFDSKLYMSAQQIPRDDPCDFCFCFRGDIICLQQSCPPPIPGCYEEKIAGFCCPRYECMAKRNMTITTTSSPPVSYQSHVKSSRIAACEIGRRFYDVGDIVEEANTPCLRCKCGENGYLDCRPLDCGLGYRARRYSNYRVR